MNDNKKVVVAVSGGFDPIHPGHIRLFKEARALGDQLVVILNNDNWLKKKKKYNFMSVVERKEVLEAIRWVDMVIVTRHPKDPQDMSVSEALARLKPDIFANGGDRNKKDAVHPSSSLHQDIKTCRKLGIRMVFNIGRGGKIQSSSDLVDKAASTAPRKIAVTIKGSKGRK
ncbi:MAG: adenylyltransferase/cytidyltransferase family protein [Candidatus Doudnabacteria bacterium]|nr:adenylyltransferase/cytidyltransferase family protein [Candidatus Doudnabacteria bacterium]